MPFFGRELPLFSVFFFFGGGEPKGKTLLLFGGVPPKKGAPLLSCPKRIGLLTFRSSRFGRLVMALKG